MSDKRSDSWSLGEITFATIRSERTIRTSNFMGLVIVVCWSETRCSKRPKRLGTIVRRWLWKLFCFLFLSRFFLSLSLPFYLPPLVLFSAFFFFPKRQQRILLGRQTNEISFYEHSTTSRSWDRRVRGKRFEKRNAIVITEYNFEFAGSYSFSRTAGAFVLISRFSSPLSWIPISRVPFCLFLRFVLLLFLSLFPLSLFFLFSYSYRILIFWFSPSTSRDSIDFAQLNSFQTYFTLFLFSLLFFSVSFPFLLFFIASPFRMLG